MTNFTEIVSLGYRCRTTERLRKYFGFDQAFPFDWWITPLRGGADFLREWNADILYNPDLLVEETERRGDIAFIRNERYRIKLQHEFPKAAARGSVSPDWRAHLAQAKARTMHLMARFDRLDDPARAVLFVREIASRDLGRPRHLALLREAVVQRAGAARASFLLISPAPVAAPGWEVVVVDDPDPRPWQGSPAVWDTALARLGHRLIGGARSGPDPADAAPATE